MAVVVADRDAGNAARIAAAMDAADPASVEQAMAGAEARFGSLDVMVASAVLVVIEVVVLLTGVVSRLVFGASIVWTDELASSLFLWLAMLGAVLAARRSVHMRMSALTAKLPPGWQAFFEALGLAATNAFLLLLLRPGVDYAVDQSFITSPALGIPDAWRAAALPAGVAPRCWSRCCAWR